MNKIVVVGQTPPPYGGQAIMIDYMLKGAYENLKFYHVRMCFSKEMNQRGKLSFYKITHLISIIIKIYIIRFKHDVHVLYYPLSNSPKISIYRDFIILALTRFLFKNTVFHFHAAGISEELPKLNWLSRNIIFLFFKKPDLTITSSEFNPNDGDFLKAKKTVIIPLGIPDLNDSLIERKNITSPLTILFIGLLNSSKGEGYLLEAIRILHEKKYNVKLLLAGKFESENYKKEFFNKVLMYQLDQHIEYRGVVTGDAKRNIFIESDIFCFPSFFESESFGIVLLEAMQYQLPLIATKWRGIQSVVQNEKNGLLIEIKSVEEIAKAILFFIENPILLSEFGKASREIFLKKYTLERYLYNLEQELKSI